MIILLKDWTTITIFFLLLFEAKERLISLNEPIIKKVLKWKMRGRE